MISGEIEEGESLPCWRRVQLPSRGSCTKYWIVKSRLSHVCFLRWKASLVTGRLEFALTVSQVRNCRVFASLVGCRVHMDFRVAAFDLEVIFHSLDSQIEVC